MNGYNPLRHDCEKQGCFNKTRRPKIEEFAECFPGKIAMSDIDGYAEVQGRIFYLEWKTPGAPLQTGQRIAFNIISKTPGNVVLVCWGDAETMEVHEAEFFLNSCKYILPEANLQSVKDFMCRWARAASIRKEMSPYELIGSHVFNGLE